MDKETMMKILDNPQSYNSDERLTAVRLAIAFLDSLAEADEQYNKLLWPTPKS